MEEFLTRKGSAKVRTAGEIACMVTLILLFFAGISIMWDDLTMKKGDLFTDILMEALLLWGMWGILVRWKRRKQAQCVALALHCEPSSAMPYDQLCAAAGISQPEKVLMALIRKGYLRDIAPDNGRKTVCMKNRAQARKEPEYAAVVCSGCSASSRILKGSVTPCPYCGTQLEFIEQ